METVAIYIAAGAAALFFVGPFIYGGLMLAALGVTSIAKLVGWNPPWADKLDDWAA
jgi:hypothetical protein